MRRNPDYLNTYGIRAHEKMDWRKSLWSILVPWHNEWLAILIYLTFGLYFLIETFMILGRSPIYKLKYDTDYDFMFVGTIGIAISLLTTATHLIFSSMSKKWLLILDMLDFMGKVIMVFFFTFAFIGSELVGSDVYYPFLFAIVTLLTINIVLVQYETGRLIAFAATVALLAVLYLYDFVFTSTPKQKEVFYIPMFVELILVGTGYLLYVFSLPERCCRSNKFSQLYVTGYVLFTLFLINFYFEAQDILYLTIKLNSGYYKHDEDNWWHTDNIYHK